MPESEFDPEPIPNEASAVFGERLPLAEKYAELLVRDGDLLGLIGPRELPKLWTRHILNSAVVGELVKPGQNVADVGSGAGFPGVPMAIKCPDVQFTLIEPMERRATWLAETVVPSLGLTNVKVLRARAEEALFEAHDVVTARAVSALPQLIKMLVPLTKNGGEILALKGSKAADEIKDSKNLVKKFKIKDFEIVTVGGDSLTDPTTVVRITLL